MHALLLVLPILIPQITAAASFLAWRSRRVQRWLGVIGAVALFGAAIALLQAVQREGIVATQIGGWPAPFGITLVADVFSAIMVVLVGITGIAITLASLDDNDVDPPREQFGHYPLVQILLMGVCGAFLTGDLFNLYVWFEVLLIASFMLLALGGTPRQMKGAIKYVTINLVSSTLFLVAIGLIYGIVGTLNMADLAVKLRDTEMNGLVTTLAVLFLMVFGIKAGMFPLFFWLPDSYPTPPAAVSALFAALLTKVGVYSLIRVFTLIFVTNQAYTNTLILIIAGLTMFTGMMGALAQRKIGDVVSFFIIGQIGYVLMGLGIGNTQSLTGAIFLIIEDVIVLQGLFLINGVLRRVATTDVLGRMGGFYRAHPGIAVFFLVPALSLAGIPPLPGFFAKLALVQGGLSGGQFLIVFVALSVAVVTLLTVGRFWAEVFWKPLPATTASGLASHTIADSRLTLLTIGALITLVALLGLGAEPVLALANQAATQLLDPAAYLQIVLGS